METDTRGTGYRLAGWLGIAALYAWVLHRGWLMHFSGYAFNVDAAEEIWLSKRLADGEVLYRDVHYLFGPFGPYLNALLIRISPLAPIETIRLAGTVNLLLCGWLTDRIARRLLSSALRPWVQALFLVGIAVPGALGMGSSLWTPYMPNYGYGLTWGLLAAWTAIDAAGSCRALHLAGMSVALGGAMLCKVDAVGAPFLASLAVGALAGRKMRVWGWTWGAAALMTGSAVLALVSLGADPREVSEALIPTVLHREIGRVLPRFSAMDPDSVRGGAYLAFALVTGWAFLLKERRPSPAWTFAFAVGWLSLAVADRWYLLLRLMQAHAALATWGLVAWCARGGGRVRPQDWVLAAAAAGCWARAIAEHGALPLGWSHRPMSPILLLAMIRFWEAVAPLLVLRGSRTGLDPARAGRAIRAAAACLLALGMLRMWRLSWREPTLVHASPMGSIRIEAKGSALWLEAVDRCREIAGRGGRIVQIPGNDLLLALGQRPPLGFASMDVCIYGREGEVIRRLEDDPGIRHVALVFLKGQNFWFGTEYGVEVADYLDRAWEVESTIGGGDVPFRLMNRPRQDATGSDATIYFLRRKGL